MAVGGTCGFDDRVGTWGLAVCVCYLSFFRPLTDSLQDYLGGHYAADPADRALTIAMAMSDTPLPLHSPPPTPQRRFERGSPPHLPRPLPPQP